MNPTNPIGIATNITNHPAILLPIFGDNTRYKGTVVIRIRIPNIHCLKVKL